MSRTRIGRYEVKGVLGRGGMATVYHAHDPSFSRDVAIKVLPRDLLEEDSAGFRSRFDREAKIIAMLEHPAVVPVYDFGEDHGQPYLVLRYMPGGTLADRIHEHGTYTLKQVTTILERVGPALAEAHTRGIVHRDLKPANILFDQYGDAYLSDFGIVKIIQSSSVLTTTGAIGTPAYMSPEQAYGESELDGRSDIYSLGVIIFEMLTGRALFEADTPMGVAMKHILEPAPDITVIRPNLPPEVQVVLARALAKNPEDRYQRVDDMVADMLAVANGRPLASLGDGRRVALITPGVARRFSMPPRPIASPPFLTPELRRQKSPPAQTPGMLPWLIVGGVVLIMGLALVLGMQLAASVNQAADIAAENPGPSELTFTATPLSEEPIEGSPGTSLPALSIPLDDDMELLDVSVYLGGSRASITGGAGRDLLYQADYFTPPGRDDLGIGYEERGTTALVVIEQRLPPGFVSGQDLLAQLDLSIAESLPLNLALTTEVGDVTLDLTDLQLQSLRIEQISGQVVVRLPTTQRLTFDARVHEGTLRVEVPTDLGVRLDFDGVPARLAVDSARLQQADPDQWITERFDLSHNQASLHVLALSGMVYITDK